MVLPPLTLLVDVLPGSHIRLVQTSLERQI